MTLSEADLSIDRSSLHKIYESWPKHFAEASNIKATLDREPEFYRNIMFCGMGGSGTSCDILNDLIRYSGKIPSIVLRGDRMPSFVEKNSVVIIKSVSGNTREALVMLEQASKTKAEVICISSGGKLKDLAIKFGHKHVLIPNLSLPRASLPYLIMPGLRLVSPFLNPREIDLGDVPKQLSKISKEISVEVPVHENISKRIAYFLIEGFAFCFASPHLSSVRTRFKSSLNENAKMHCLTESALEASHNEIVPFTYNNRLDAKVILLGWVEDYYLVGERLDKIKNLFNGINLPFIEVTATEKSLLSAILSSIYKLDFATLYMAVLRKVDPSPTPAIDILKRL